VLKRFLIAFAVANLYTLGWIVGLFLLIVPGVLVMIYGSLATVPVLLEKQGPIASFKNGYQLTRGHFWQIFRYLAPPCLVFFPGLVIAQWILVSIVDPNAYDVPLTESWTLSGHVPAGIISVLAGMLLCWFVLSMILLQVKMYHQLQTQD
jgi:hypothetical protein